MAGKGKKQGNRHAAPNSARGMMGHLGLKSSALAPTDSKLTSQYMVLDHMTAHYKNLSKAKSAIDNKTPKAWLISQKARDKARRQALKDEHNRRNQWLASSISSRPPTRDSERDRDELIAMMESFSALDEDYDDIDGAPNVSSSVTTSKANRLNEDDMNFVNNMVSDSAQSPSRYRSQKVMKTNIPSSKSKPYSKPSHSSHKEAIQIPSRAHKQSSGDLIEKQAHRFTEEKPFTPRTLKSKVEVPSRLTSFKYYTAPKKSARDPPAPVPAPRATPARRGSMVSRPETTYSDSVDLMNETLMSRDHGLKDKPMGVPALDISLDADNMRWMKEHAQQGWLQEQSKKAHIRASAGARSDAGSDMGSVRYEPRHDVRGAHSKTLNGTHTMTGEEELKYLEFVTEVTNDVLDRGIFTNRVLKQVFDTHIEKRKHELKTQRMYEMLDDLRLDLGIPDDNDDEDMGMRSVRSPELHTETTGAFDGTATYSQNTGPRAARRKQLNGSADDYGTRGSLPNLRGGRRRVSSGEGRPPLPRPVSRGSRSRPGSSCSNLQDVKEEAEDSSLTFTFSDTPTSSGQANILKIDHDDPESLQRMEEAENGSSEEMTVNGTSELDGYHQQYHRQEDRLPDDVEFDSRHKDPCDAGFKPLSVEEDTGDRRGTDDMITMSEAQETLHARTGSDDEEQDDMTELYTRQIDQTSDGEDSQLSRGDSYKDNTRLPLGDNDMNETQLSTGDNDRDDTRLSLDDNNDTRLSLDDHDDYSDAFHEDDQDTLREESAAETPRSAPPKPTPRSRKPVSSSEFTPRSTELTHTTSESVTVSELGTEDGDF